MDVEELLSPEFRVALEAWRMLNKEDISYSNLVKRLDGRVSKVTVHKAIDNLSDAGILYSSWIKNDKGRWYRALVFDGDMGFIEVIKEVENFVKLANT